MQSPEEYFRQWWQSQLNNRATQYVVHLSSEKGQAMNGKPGRVVGGDPWDRGLARRLAFQLDFPEGTPIIRVLPWKLMPSEVFHSCAEKNNKDPGRLSPDRLCKAAKTALKRGQGGSNDRPDCVYRKKWLEQVAIPAWEKGKNAPALDCQDPGDARDDPRIVILLSARFACHGDSKCSLERFNRDLQESELDEKLPAKLKEFILSGMCERCQQDTFESD